MPDTASDARQSHRPEPVVDRPLRELIDDCATLRALAAAAIDKSKRIMPTVAGTVQTSLDRRLASRAHLLYARLDGMIEGNAVAAVVRTTGEVVAGKEVLSRAQIVVSLGDTFDDGRILASLDAGPVTSTLTFMRAMDRVDGLDLALRWGTATEPTPDKPRPSRGRRPTSRA